MKRIILFLFLVIPGLAMAQDAPLRRAAWMGARMQPVDQTNFETFGLKQPQGIAIAQVVGGTSETLQIEANDVLIELNGNRIDNYDAFVSELNAMRAGDKVSATMVRAGKKIIKKGVAVGREMETSETVDIIYDEAPFRDGRLRVIINKPKSEEKLPAVLFIPGYTCSSINGLTETHPYGRVVNAFAEAGFVVLRIEKSGLGDSENTPSCESCDLADEIENFEQGLLKLQSLPYVDTSKVFIFGHSMGGIVAPAVAAKHRVKGIMAYGTTAKSWFEYQVEMNRVQGMLSNPDPLEFERYCREQSDLAHMYFIQKKELTEMAEDPHIDSLLRAGWQYDGAGNIFGRNANYWRQIQDMPLLENWISARANALVMYGGADFQAFSKADHEQIVHAVNYHAPGKARLAVFPEADHYFAKSGTMQNAYNLFASGQYQVLFETFEPEVTKTAVAWAKEMISPSEATEGHWKKLSTEPYGGKQDDIHFIDRERGWYVNGAGRIYHTRDGGSTWTKQIDQPGTFFRTVYFLDENTGFAGTVGTDYFPNVSDTIPLYKTKDGGSTWAPAPYDGPYVKGLCAIDAVKEPYINHGVTAYKTHIFAVGRVGSPAMMITSHDGGETFASATVDGAKMLFDIKMFDKLNGIACAANHEDISQSNALIIKTSDGGKTWKHVYTSDRPFETTWKASFPSRNVGYVTIQSYNPDTNLKQQRIAKTTDGGETWKELPLCQIHEARPFGIGFLDENHGFVGTRTGGYETIDGGLTWTPVDIGLATNKIRFHSDTDGKNFGYAIGVDVFKFE
jgi:photosystem II stability/assembly factor-like uncharacterized protein/pimeloyl-ACP methyl ester carboxylesterase